MAPNGAVAEWLGRGLQSLVHRFDSGRRLTRGPPGRDGTVAPRGGELLAPRSGEPFVVVVGVSSRADAAWDDYKAQQRRDTFDSQDPFDVRRGNVLAISDGGLSRFDRARIVDAMSSLPDRGAEVDVAGRV
jgi:hypothetical protein